MLGFSSSPSCKLPAMAEVQLTVLRRGVTYLAAG